jgi:hypothetical protein
MSDALASAVTESGRLVLADLSAPTTPLVRIERAIASVEHTLAVAAAIEQLRARGWKYDS